MALSLAVTFSSATDRLLTLVSSMFFWNAPSRPRSVGDLPDGGVEDLLGLDGVAADQRVGAAAAEARQEADDVVAELRGRDRADADRAPGPAGSTSEPSWNFAPPPVIWKLVGAGGRRCVWANVASSVSWTSRSPVRTDAIEPVDLGLRAVDVDGGVDAEVLAVGERAVDRLDADELLRPELRSTCSLSVAVGQHRRADAGRLLELVDRDRDRAVVALAAKRELLGAVVAGDLDRRRRGADARRGERRRCRAWRWPVTCTVMLIDAVVRELGRVDRARCRSRSRRRRWSCSRARR